MLPPSPPGASVASRGGLRGVVAALGRNELFMLQMLSASFGTPPCYADYVERRSSFLMSVIDERRDRCGTDVGRGRNGVAPEVKLGRGCDTIFA
jgi:hypothetical protein